MKILVTGGAGYIGSFMTKQLLDYGHEVLVLDSLERGFKAKVDERANFIQGDIREVEFVQYLFSKEKFEAVFHFAAYIAVGESMQKPEAYFTDNVLGTLNILNAMQRTGVKKIIFSSTGTVYGTPQKNPIPEDHPKNPENPYAESKLMVEKLLKWYGEIYGIHYAILRYFNASGAELDGSNGEKHNPETHLIPRAILAALNNAAFHLYGDDYPTTDGTCIRDYIHVLDLITAHVLALNALETKPFLICNVGTGKGYTNKEVVEMVKQVSGWDFPVVIEKRREGDVAETVADVTKVTVELGFTPRYSDLKTIVESAWKWHKSQHTTTV